MQNSSMTMKELLRNSSSSSADGSQNTLSYLLIRFLCKEKLGTLMRSQIALQVKKKIRNGQHF